MRHPGARLLPWLVLLLLLLHPAQPVGAEEEAAPTQEQLAERLAHAKQEAKDHAAAEAAAEAERKKGIRTEPTSPRA